MAHPAEYPRDPAQEIRVPREHLETLLKEMFVKKSVFAVDAKVAAARMVEADARGIPSHGCRLMAWYLDAFDDGHIDPRGQVLTLTETPAIATLDGSRALGQVAATKAMELAIEKAKAVGTGTIIVKNSHHFGAAGVYAQLAIDAGVIGHCMTSSGRATVAAYGSRGGATCNHAIAWGIPTSEGPPMLIDISSAQSSWGKVRQLAQYGLPIPPGWALDENQEPTTDGKAAKMLLPAGGSRGYGLGLVAGVLSSALVGTRMPINRKRETLADGSQHFFSVIDPEKFGDPDRFQTRLQEAITAIEELEPEPGFDRVRIPGARQWEALKRSETEGVALHKDVAEKLASLAESMNLTTPW